MMMTKALILMSATLLCSGIASAESLVVTGESVPTRRVGFGDLNLGSEAGKARLAQRIRAAARDLCVENIVQPLETALPQRACFQRAMSDGNRQMTSAIAARQSGIGIAAAVLTIRGQ
jgi:UrcA family protein